MRSRTLRFSILFGALALLGSQVNAQYAWDFGIHVGGANYLGEMGGTDQPRRDFVWDMKLSQTRWAIGGFARRKINRSISLNTGLLYLRIQGANQLHEPAAKPRLHHGQIEHAHCEGALLRCIQTLPLLRFQICNLALHTGKMRFRFHSMKLRERCQSSSHFK